MFNIVSKLKDKRSLWPYFFEFLTVLLSVYLAFLITEWRENHKEKQDTKLSIERLNQEIFQNYKVMISFKKEVAKRLEKMQVVEEIIEPQYSFTDYIGVFNGFRYANFNDASWKRASEAKIGNLMPIEYIENVHTLYSHNTNLTQHNLLINNLMYSDYNFDNKKCEYAYNIAELYVWQQATWSIEDTYSYTRFIQEYRNDFEILLQKDSATNAYFTSRDTLSKEQWKKFRSQEFNHINSFRKSENRQKVIAKIRSLKS